MSAGNSYPDELRRAIQYRIHEIQRITSELRGAIPSARQSLHKAFDLLNGLPDGVAGLVASEIERAPDSAALTTILENILRHLSFVADFIEKHLAHGGRHELPQGLSDEISEELQTLNLGHYNVILSHGSANNFVTLFGDIDQHINSRFGLADPATPTADKFFALFRIPRIEGLGVFWRPILIGHEVAHIYVSEEDLADRFNLREKFDFDRAITFLSQQASDGSASSGSINAAMNRLFRISLDWTTELLCDARALLRYGPASIAALGEYFATTSVLEQLEESHPPGRLRIYLMLNWLDQIADVRLRRMLEPWRDQSSSPPTYVEPWAQFLVDMFISNRDEIPDLATTSSSPRYEFESRAGSIHVVADRLVKGIAGSERHGATRSRILKPDVVNAAWLARSESADTPIDPLARKALESISFVDRWIDRGGDLPELPRAGDAEASHVTVDGALSEAGLRLRLARGDEDGGIVATPLLQLPKGSALDLRLGSRFIVFRRTRDASFDPLRSDTDPRSIQNYQELSWTEQIVLHPQELLLAATLEYLVLPNDLTAQVITRSSYGRLGLLSATAVQVHPNFHGCLTLELVNLSNLPLVLTPGERVAQLVAWKTDPVQESDEKYRCPVGPEFSKARTDAESDILRRIRGT